jgi:cysteine synthase A
MKGAKVILTPKELGGAGMVAKAKELSETKGYFLTSQFTNLANPAFHRQTTASEILSDFAGTTLTHFVSGWGTGGTITGVSSMLKLARPDVKIIACEPSKAPLLQGGKFSPHMLQGWTPNFLPEVLDPNCFDELILCEDAAAIAASRALAKQEGIFVGISAGATFDAALQIAKNAPEGSSILAMLPDCGERYLSTPLFAGISEESDIID